RHCYHIPDVNQDVSEILKRHIGSYETHEVQTEDGYILTLFRISRKNPKGVIFFQHPYANDARIFHEMGYYDNYATLGYIRTKTQVSKIIYFGFSLSSASGLVYACLRPHEAAQSIKVMINMAPAVLPRYVNSVILYFVPVADFMENYVNLMLTQVGSEVSHKTLYHLIQIHRSGGNFRMYDYGKEENVRLYGKEEPPLYPLNKIKIPVLLVYSENDSLAPP
ncbi:Abhydro lipase domain containing protein, partial [Asbolus verrucosus]